MRRLAVSSLTDQDISTALLTHTYTADADRGIFVRLFASSVQGDGDYVAWITVQREGAGSTYAVGPKTTFTAAAGETAIAMTTVVVPVKENDVVKVYILGQAGDDVDPDIVTEIWDDAITVVKIVDGAITADKIAANAIANAKIADGAISVGKLADGAIANAKLADSALSLVKVAADLKTGDFLNAQVRGQDNIDFSTLQKAALDAATPASVTGAVGSVTNAVTVGTNNDKTGYSLSGTLTTLDAIWTKIQKWLRLALRSDAATATDCATELTEINADGGSGAGDYANTADAQEALRDRGDAAWVTATGFAVAGSEMDLVNAPNATAITAIQSGLATSTNQTTILNRLGAWAGTGVNTLLGAFQALLRKDASAPSDIGGTFDPATDSTEAIRDTEPMGTAMRGTDGAYTGTPPTADAIGTDAASKVLATPANKLATNASGQVEASNMRGTDDAALANNTPNKTVWTDALASLISSKLDVSGTIAHSDAANSYKADVSGLSTLTAPQVWQNAERTLTDKSGFSLAVAYDAAKTAAQAGDSMALTAAAVDAIHDEVVEDELTLRQIQRILLARGVGLADGGDTEEITFLAQDGATVRIRMTVDENGNRTVVVLDGA